MELTVYLADDDIDDREFFKMSIEILHSKISLLMFQDGQDLMNHMSKDFLLPPDIIFLDINMPRKNGHECLCEIRGNSRYNGIPVIMCSTSTDEPDVAKAFNNGATLYIKKPSTFLQEIDVLREIFVLHLNKELLKYPKERFVIPSDLKLH